MRKRNAPDTPLGFSRVVVPDAHCAVLIDMRRESTAAMICAWILRSYTAFLINPAARPRETLKSISKRMGYANSSNISAKLGAFLDKWTDREEYDITNGDYRRRLTDALNNYKAAHG